MVGLSAMVDGRGPAGQGKRRRLATEARVRALYIVQTDCSTPTGLRNARFYIHGILGTSDVFTFTR
jgi:hypothetical protein